MFLFHFYHFHHVLYDSYCFESDQHKYIRHSWEKCVKSREIEELLQKIGLHNNMDTQYFYIEEDKRIRHENILCNRY